MSPIARDTIHANNVGYLQVMLALNEQSHERRFGRKTSFAFAWMLLGFLIGGWLVSQWA
jgi:hypothetical protein